MEDALGKNLLIIVRLALIIIEYDEKPNLLLALFKLNNRQNIIQCFFGGLFDGEFVGFSLATP